MPGFVKGRKLDKIGLKAQDTAELSFTEVRAAVDAAVSYVSSRQVFGKPLASFQNTKFELAACATEVEAGQALLDRALLSLLAGSLSGAQAAAPQHRDAGAWSTGACSCSAATGTSPNTRSPACTPTRG